MDTVTKASSLAPRITGMAIKTIGALNCLSKKFKKLIPYTEDMVYKINFSTRYAFDFFGEHVMQNYENCAFCSNLKKSGSKKQFHSCSKGIYNFPGQLVPDTLCTDSELDEHGTLAEVPWFYRKPCTYFNRLSRKKYLRNFRHPFSDKTVSNYEVLEGLEYGLSSNRKPCHICASIDYSIFRDCLAEKEHEATDPCHQIATIVSSKYTLTD